jgi:hypothetical protein
MSATLHPNVDSRCATAKPIPAEPPVISATLELSTAESMAEAAPAGNDDSE